MDNFPVDNLSVEGTLRLIALIIMEGHDQVAVKLAPEYLLEAADTITELKERVKELEQEIVDMTHLMKMDGA